MEIAILINKIELIYESWGLLLIFFSSFIETSPLGWTIPGGTMVALGGFFAYGKNPFNLIGVIMAGWLGMLSTFLIAYFIGHKTQMRLAKFMRQEKNTERAKNLLRNHGPVILTTSLLANLTRFWVSYIAGVEKYNLSKFLFYAGAASLTWNSLLVVVGYLAGAERGNLEKGIANLGIIAWGFLFIALGVIYWKTRKDYHEFIEENKNENS